MKVAIAQISPILLDRKSTIQKVVSYVEQAGKQGCKLIAFGEALIPGYSFWLERTDGAKFDSERQKEIFSMYNDQAIDVEGGDLAELCQVAKSHSIAVAVGTIEKSKARSGHSVFCSAVYINSDGSIGSVHRKLVPTYDERLCWAYGDGNGLRTHALDPFTVGVLNCWENWMPLARTSLYAQGENLHVAIWPGSKRNTIDITRFIALESRSYVISASGFMRPHDVPNDFPYRDMIVSHDEEYFANGGSCIATPKGDWLIEPVIEKEELLVAELDFDLVRKERQMLDVCGHYSRPDVLKLTVNRQRQTAVELED